MFSQKFFVNNWASDTSCNVHSGNGRETAWGRAASVCSSNSSLESGHLNSAARKQPVGSAYSRPSVAVRTADTAMTAVGV
ncbi:hypothetical protein C2L66_35885 [Paraburkholderia caribensis]|nr:hypothetical protein C2L66_35885 [Paraburkholderia caribensis]